MFRRALFAAACLAAGFAAGLVLTGRLRTASESVAATQTAQRPAASAVLGGLPDFSSVAARGVSGIVNISAESVVRRSPYMIDPFFSQFFGADEDWFGSRYRSQQSLGSGVVISADGYIVTNNHVLGSNAEKITVVLPDKREVRGQIAGRDPMTDIAVIRVSATNLAVVPWGDSSKLKVGQWVLAVGSPFQLNQTVTLGIVSAVGRTGVGVADYEDFIQTDAAINPGNSGGGLLDSRGDLIGINTAILSQSGGYQGVGFAVPSNLARRIADDLIKYREVRRGWIGAMRIESLTPEWAEQLEIPKVRGALVVEMTRTSAAFEAGIRPGDVIVGFNGQPIEDDAQFRKRLSDATIGSTATLDLLRNGRKMQVQVPVTVRSTRTR